MSQKHKSKKTLLSPDEKLWRRISSKFGKDEDKWLKFIWEEAKNKAKEDGFTLPEFEKFWKNGFQEVLSPKKQTILLEEFRMDPENYPISTPSGKIEIFSETIDSFNYKDCPGHPTWLEQEEWLGSNLTKQFPLQLISGQPHNRLHSQLDNGSESKSYKILGREPIKIHPQDAQTRRLFDGDIVVVFTW